MTCSRCHRIDCRVSELVQLLTTDIYSLLEGHFVPEPVDSPETAR